jgi:hypothetical protein
VLVFVEAIVIQLALLVAVHAHFSGAVTPTLALPPGAEKNWLICDSEAVQLDAA